MSAVIRQEQPAADLIALAIEHKADVDTLERLFALKERQDASDAKAAFFAAMREVQARAPAVVKDATNAQTNSTYAKLESIARALKPIYTEAGFSLMFGEGTAALDGYKRITVRVMHTAGHYEDSHIDLPLDDVGLKGTKNKTGTHAAGSTVSYGRRYLTLMVFNVVMAGEDDDGQAADNSMEKLDRLIKMIALARDHWWESIVCIRENFREGGDLSAAAEAYAEMPRQVIADLFIAPTKGGLFTTTERARCKDDKEFQALVHQYRTDAGWYQRPENEV